MQQVLIDACGWVACVDAKLNIEREMERLIGPCQWILIPEVLTELNALEAERSPAKRLLLSLLEVKSVLVVNENEELSHTDDILYQMACELQCATLTVDTGLKRRLYEKNLTVLEVRKGTRMHVLESL
jgi:rRNA-processing protein FCF1